MPWSLLRHALYCMMIAANRQSPCRYSMLTSSTCSLGAFGPSLISCLLSVLMREAYWLSVRAFDKRDSCIAFSMSSSSRDCVCACMSVGILLEPVDVMRTPSLSTSFAC